MNYKEQHTVNRKIYCHTCDEPLLDEIEQHKHKGHELTQTYIRKNSSVTIPFEIKPIYTQARAFKPLTVEIKTPPKEHNALIRKQPTQEQIEFCKKIFGESGEPKNLTEHLKIKHEQQAIYKTS